MTITTEFLNKAALVVAHPDDEILWFSSTIRSVDKIVFCYLGIEEDAAASEGRKRVLQSYPIQRVTVLGLDEAGVYDHGDWNRPQPRPYGLALRREDQGTPRETRYVRNFEILNTRLRDVLAGYKNVITHNPWGEYGNEEHIQVHRAVKSLQTELGFDLWCSNYCSNKSFRLAISHFSGYHSDYRTLKTDKVIAAEVRDLYMRHGCWTWYDDYEWFNEESFIQANDMAYNEDGRGHAFPLNIVRMDRIEKWPEQPGRRERLLRLVAQILRLPDPRRND